MASKNYRYTVKPFNLGRYYIPKETKGGICLEVGANVGSFFTTYSDHFSVIHYYEPVEQCYSICKEKSAELHNVTGYNLAGYHTSGLQINLLNHKQRQAGSIAVEDLNNGDWLQEEIVGTPTTIDLKDMVDRFNTKEIDYLKLDCETSEYHILLNKDLTPFKFIAMELHWQMGEDKWYELLQYIKQTHTLTSGGDTWRKERNTELFFTRK